MQSCLPTFVISRFLTDLSGGKDQGMCLMKKVETSDKRAVKQDINSFTVDVCNYLSDRVNFWPFGKLNCL